jgi:hypothetical protein
MFHSIAATPLSASVARSDKSGACEGSPGAVIGTYRGYFLCTGVRLGGLRLLKAGSLRYVPSRLWISAHDHEQLPL